MAFTRAFINVVAIAATAPVDSENELSEKPHLDCFK